MSGMKKETSITDKTKATNYEPLLCGVFLNELAAKHKVDVNKIIIGMQYGDIQVWRYDPGAYEIWKTLETIPLNAT